MSKTGQGHEPLKDRGNLYFAEKKYDKAIGCYSDAIAKGPQQAVQYTNRALCYLKLGKWSEAVEDCRKAIQLDHISIKAHFFLGQALTELQSYDDAIFSLRTAHELAKEQRKNFSEDITSAVRHAKRKRWNAIEEKRLKQESEFRSFLVQLLSEHRDRQLSERNDTVAASEAEGIHREYANQLSQLNSLFQELDDRRKRKEVPDYLCGRISFDLMSDPCITPSGITYDRKDIDEHLQETALKRKFQLHCQVKLWTEYQQRVGHFDPVTRQELTQDQLVPNLAMKEVVEAFIAMNGWVEDY